jgi:signal transduction histidine kinase
MLEQETQIALNDHHLIKKSLHERLLSVSENYDEFNSNNLAFLIQPYAGYYGNQQIYLEFYLKGELVYTSFAFEHGFSPNVSEGQVGYGLIETGDTPFLCITSVLDAPFSDMRLLYIKNEQQIKDYKSQITAYCIAVSVIVSVILAVVIIAMLLRLTSPLRKLNRAAIEIAVGNYSKKVDIKSHDEVGELASSFNAMSTHVQSHIDELSELTESKQQFVDNLAHEIRTPITAILGYGEILGNERISDDEKNMAISYIISQSERIKNLSAKLIDLAYLGSVQADSERVALQEIIGSVEATVRKSCEEKNIEFAKHIDVDFLYTDRDLLETLLQNLVENAIRAVAANGKVVISAFLEDAHAVILVADNGIGMRQDELSKISEPFYRVDKSRSRKHGGVGLGLSLCDSIAKVLGAELSFTSELGKGTTAKVKFTAI